MVSLAVRRHRLLGARRRRSDRRREFFFAVTEFCARSPTARLVVFSDRRRRVGRADCPRMNRHHQPIFAVIARSGAVKRQHFDAIMWSSSACTVASDFANAAFSVRAAS
jgi:N-glycosylase/DNA lyase